MTDPLAALRVATWNVRAAIGPGPFPERWWRRIDGERLRAIGEVITALDADVVALQEVAVLTFDGELVDNAADLARHARLEVRFAATRHFAILEADGRQSGAGLFGNALLSRVRFGATRTVALPMAPDTAYVEPPGADHPAAGTRYIDAPATIREPRCALIAEIGGWTIGSAHFSHIGSRERALQAAKTVDAFAGAIPSVLLGDLNAAIESPELAAFAAWTDGFAAAGVPPRDERRVSTEDGWRIDHVLARGASVRGCRAVHEAGDLSDHYPVTAEVTVD